MTTTTPTTTASPRPGARTDAFWLRLTQVGIALAIVGLLMMGLAMLFGTFHDNDFHAVDYVLTSAALPQGVGLLIATLGFHRLQRGRDGRLGTAGVWVYGGGLEDHRATIVAPDGVVTDGPFPETKEVIGGFVVLELDSKDEALAWAAKLAVACRCPQEVRELLPEPTL